MKLQNPLGQLTGVGVGPGDPELLTLKGLKAIQNADIIAYPAPDTGPSFARSIVAGYLRGQAEYQITVPMAVKRFPAQEVYDKAAADLAKALEAGKNVVVLCEGDPFFYGSFMYLYQRLYSRFRTTVIPGISSVMSMAAVAGRPLCERNDVLQIIPGPLDQNQLVSLFAAQQPLIVMKVGRHLKKIKACLTQTGRLHHATYVERASLPNQRILPLSVVDDESAPYFSIIHVAKSSDQ